MLWAEFLEKTPPGVTESIDDLFKAADVSGIAKISDVDIQLYCDSEKCNGVRFFHPTITPETNITAYSYLKVFITYWCRNCQHRGKTFALDITHPAPSADMPDRAMKYGEDPPFGPPVPSRLISLNRS